MKLTFVVVLLASIFLITIIEAQTTDSPTSSSTKATQPPVGPKQTTQVGPKQTTQTDSTDNDAASGLSAAVTTVMISVTAIFVVKQIL